jgi:nucleoside-diphosphate-sugar epimerase
MIIGSGMLARAFSARFSQCNDVCVYAAGVSNSSCIDPQEFAREWKLLSAALENPEHTGVFVYFGTCSIGDPEARDTPYVQHKLAMEQLVAAHPQHLILRLPQVAGYTPNPHTLLNYLYARISRSEAFDLWNKAKRNIIDVDDVVAIAARIIADKAKRNVAINIANTSSYSMKEIVSAMARAVGKRAIYYDVERGCEYMIETGPMLPVLGDVGVEFGSDYLDRVMAKYYGHPG